MHSRIFHVVISPRCAFVSTTCFSSFFRFPALHFHSLYFELTSHRNTHNTRVTSSEVGAMRCGCDIWLIHVIAASRALVLFLFRSLRSALRSEQFKHIKQAYPPLCWLKLDTLSACLFWIPTIFFVSSDPVIDERFLKF